MHRPTAARLRRRWSPLLPIVQALLRQRTKWGHHLLLLRCRCPYRMLLHLPHTPGPHLSRLGLIRFSSRHSTTMQCGLSSQLHCYHHVIHWRQPTHHSRIQSTHRSTVAHQSPSLQPLPWLHLPSRATFSTTNSARCAPRNYQCACL
jgi:hypothetical protein